MTQLLSPAARRRCGGLFVALLVLACVGRTACADPTAPGTSERQIARTVMSMIQREHVSRHPLDKEVSERGMKSYLKALDPMKLYFYQSDVDNFLKRQDEIMDLARKGDISFGYEVFKILLERIDQRVKMIDEILAMPHDFTKDEEMLTDRDKLQYPQDAAEALDRWRKRIKFDLLVLKTDTKNKKEGKEALEKLGKRYHSFAKRMHQIDNDEILEMYLTALAMSFDPHTSYMSPGTQENFAILMRLELEGIGAQLQSEDGYTTVKSIIPGGAADKDGRLNVEDRIVGVGQGNEGEFEDVVDMKLTDVVKKMRGKRGTIVRLEVLPADKSEKKIVKIVREKIELKDSEARGEIFDAGKKADGAAYKIGVIDLPSFYMDMDGARRGVTDFKSTTRDVRNLLEDFNKKGVDAVVLDLRRNGGGALTEAINLTGLFIPDGPMVQVKDAEGHVQPFFDPDPSVTWAGPLVVLTSKFSASASEILAGAIQDYGRGLIVGDHSTHGKGTVQSLKDLGQELFRVPNSPSMGAIKITMQQFYRPHGESTQKRGVLADVELPSLTTHMDVGEADLDYSLPFDKVDPLKFKLSNDVTPAVTAQLRKQSEERVKTAEKFQKVARNITRYLEQKAKKKITLNEAKFLKEQEELNADKEDEKATEKLNEFNHPPIERDFYLDEVFNILVDYMNLRQVAKAP